MLMSGEELAQIQPDYIILDEFHRAGAEMWGEGVRNLLKTYPDAPILGLSATNIRYQQRILLLPSEENPGIHAAGKTARSA